MTSAVTSGEILTLGLTGFLNLDCIRSSLFTFEISKKKKRAMARFLSQQNEVD
jgi:hypothetical protein